MTDDDKKMGDLNDELAEIHEDAVLISKGPDLYVVKLGDKVRKLLGIAS